MKTNRRGFLTGMISAGAAPWLFSGCARGFLACRKVNVGVIGYGRIAHTMDVPGAQQFTERCVVTAVCDYDSVRAAYGKRVIEERYAKQGIVQHVKTYGDYREMLADPSIDAVMLCIPDHWHAIIATDAVLAGKHIYLQKPFTQTIEEGRVLRDLAMMRGTVLQVGSWQRSKPQYELVCNLVQQGRIGDVVRVEVGCGLDKEGGSSVAEPVPENLDYDTWLGPTPGPEVTPYNWTRVHNQDLKHINDRPGWIQLEPYGWGMITNWGAHQIDVAQWGLGMDDYGPDSVEGTCERMSTAGGKLWNVHTKYDLHYSYNNGKTDVNVSDKYPMGIKFIGEKGEWLYCMRGKVKVTPSDPDVPSNGKMQPLMASKNILLEKIAKPEIALHTSDCHWKNWLEAIRLGDPTYTVTNAEEAQRSSTACCLGQMCMELGRGKKEGASIKWCAEKEDTCCPGAKKLMTPFSRGKYDLATELARYGFNYDKVLRG